MITTKFCDIIRIIIIMYVEFNDTKKIRIFSVSAAAVAAHEKPISNKYLEKETLQRIWVQ